MEERWVAEEDMVVDLVVDMVVDQVVDMEAKNWEVEEGHLQEEMVVEVGGPWRESETYSSRDQKCFRCALLP